MKQSSRDPGLLTNEAEETIAAIHQGNVDALVVSGPDGPQIVVLQNADQPYRLLVERMSDGALTVGPDDRILFANRRLAELVGSPPDMLIGRDFTTLFDGPMPAGAENVTLEARVRGADGPIPATVWISPIRIGGIAARLVTITDMSVHQRVEQAVSAERFARSILEQSTEPIVVLAPSGRITDASAVAGALAVLPPLGRTFSEAFGIDGRDARQVGELASLPPGSLDAMLATRPFHGVEIKLSRADRPNRSFLLSAGPLLDEDKAAIGAIVTLTDISDRKRAEEQQKVLVAELNHRVKNILAVVQAIASQTVRASASLDAFSSAFTGRIRALSVAHDILTRTRWIGIGLEDLLDAVLAPYRTGDKSRITLTGAPVLLPARAVVPLSMAVHELATNAAKYGALLTETGTIDIDWSLRRDDTAQHIHLTWRERGGPEIGSGRRQGFGTTLITRVLRHDLEGIVELDFAREGLACHLDFPLRTYADLNDLAGGAAH